MLKKYCFKNYADFKEIFGMRKCNNGNIVRKNKILFSLYKGGYDKVLRQYIDRETNNNIKDCYSEIFDCKDIVSLDNWFKFILGHPLTTSPNMCVYSTLLDEEYSIYSDERDWYVDDMHGICFQKDQRHMVRFIKVEGNRKKEMCCTPARFIKKVIANYPFLSLLPEQILRHFEELFAEEWKAAARLDEGYELVVNDTDFDKIYDTEYLAADVRQCNGHFNSCMVNKGFGGFYTHIDDCQCAYLLKDEAIFARCIIYNVYDGNGNCFRLAERQYSANSDDVLKHILIGKLIAGGYIDGYKKIGAGCSDTHAFVKNDGSRFNDTYFFIKLSDFDPDKDVVSYQDSFKWYDEMNGIAYNYEPTNYTHELDVTDGTAERKAGVWSDYYDHYIYDSDDYVEDRYGERYYREDCVECHNGEWILRENAAICENCGYYYDENNDGEYSNLTGEYYCCESCRIEAENSYKEDNGWTYADLEDDYYEDADDVVSVITRNRATGEYETHTIGIEEFEYSMRFNDFYVIYNGEYYIDDIDENGVPLYVKEHEPEMA